MNSLRLLLSTVLLLLAIFPVLAGCGGSDGGVKNVYLSFSEAAVQGVDGQPEFTTGDEVSAVAAIVYDKGGSGKGEWSIDGKVSPVTFELPEPAETGNTSVFTISQSLPTDSDGLHTVSFELTSPEKLGSGETDYVVSDPAPPANPTSYIVRMRVTTGHAYLDNESGLNWNDELRMLVGTKVWIPQNRDNLPPVDSSLWTAVLPPNGDDFAIQDQNDSNYEPGMDNFSWNTDLTPDIIVDSGKGVTFRTQLWEKDANIVASIFKAVAFVWTKAVGYCIGFTSSGPVGGIVAGTAMFSGISKLIDMAGSADDFIGEDVTYLDSSDLSEILAEGGTRTYTVRYDGKDHNKAKGDFELNLDISVQQRNLPAPSGFGVYVIQEYLHDGICVAGGDTEGGKEELCLSRIPNSTGGGQGVYSPPGSGDIDVQDGEVFLWEGVVSEPVRISNPEPGRYLFEGAPITGYTSTYTLEEKDPSHNEVFGTCTHTLTMEEIEAIAVSDGGFSSFIRTFSNNGREILLNFEIRVRKEPLSERFVVRTYVDGGTNISGGNTESGKEEFRLTATDVNGVSTTYSPSDGDIEVDEDGTDFAWSGELGTIQIDPIGNGQYAVAGTPVDIDSLFLVNYSLWEEDTKNHDQFGTVRHRLSLEQLNTIADSGGEYRVTSRFESETGIVELHFRIVVTREVNT